MGLFAKYLPFPCQLEEHMQLQEILVKVQEAIDNGFDRQEYFSWDQIGTAAENDMALAYFPLSFDFEQQPATYCAGEVTFSIDTQYTCVDRFHLKLVCESRSDA